MMVPPLSKKLFGFKRGHEWNEFWSEFATEPLTLCLNGPSRSKSREKGLDRAGAARASPSPPTTCRPPSRSAGNSA